MINFIHASIPLAHETLSREEVAERLLNAAKIGGYVMNASIFFTEPAFDKTNFIVYEDGKRSGFYRYSGFENTQHLSLEEFEQHCNELYKTQNK